MEIKLNLASKIYLNRQSVRLWLLLVCSSLVVLLLLNLSYGYRSYQHIKLLDSRFEELNLQVADIRGVPAGYSPERYKIVKSEIAAANQIVAADQFHWTELLNRFEVLLPKDVSIRSIQPDYKDRSIRLEGVAQNVSAMTRFMDNLLASNDFSQAFLQQHAEIDTQQLNSKLTQTGFSLVIREAF